ncbi:ABC transporter related [Beutenbergia cavernae DSM 12333]|uniref:ABC transporter related n=1 Tax=Beutenbergia cavernae (strain ATCC BAA-8 / DSM 12333 / CCUG 43141 / JCM 11478 / NBRC 16432 / NCIMB 13614 / HKI 0122) TaxID=471853 RepID=C5C3E2_BEUC1|nr:ABC transporter ATP-binding protein [Beutenbergia cavernae]ACQ79841.1 ABC transporter related [Beutenbergia cavernae DSM 12333]
MTTDALISATGAIRRYGTFEAVRGVDLTVRRGELLALLGTNGAGKTSLLELIEGLAPASGGTVRVLGHDPYRERGHVIPRVGIMLQEAGFASDLTVAETARMWAGTQTAPRPYRAALDIVGLAHRADVRVASLSGGERRRLDLALAVMGRPEVLFLDEPTTGLDPASRRATWDLVRDLLADGTTVLLTTHYLEEAEELADRIAVMHEGRIAREGTVAQIVATEPARVSFVVHDGAGRVVDVRAADLPPLAGAVAPPDVARARVSVRTDELQDDLGTILGWAHERSYRLAELDARAASLEQAFLAIAGTPSSAAPIEKEAAA